MFSSFLAESHGDTASGTSHFHKTAIYLFDAPFQHLIYSQKQRSQLYSADEQRNGLIDTKVSESRRLGESLRNFVH